MIPLRHLGAASLLLLAAAAARADAYDGQLVYDNDVLYKSIVIEHRTGLTAWTDSYLNGRNFDPILAVWHNGILLAQNDDNPYIAPGQTSFDSGVRLFDLAPGTYLFTVTAFDNFARSGRIGDGWRYDDRPGRSLADLGRGPYVTLNWSLTPAVPEPSTWAMLLGGLAVTAAALRRRTR